MRQVAPETLIDGRYRVLGRLGSGGMADVWAAEDQQLGRKVALKLLYSRFADDQDFVERFRREASSAAGLAHPNVVAVYDRGEWEGTYYIAMEYLEGRSLKEVVQAEGALDPLGAIDLTIQILRAARFAHRRGIIHRDLKPHNVILDEEERAKVTDFGIARAGASDITETGSIMGTAQYLSPEQAQGHEISAASDLYAIGIILYELLTGRVPFEAESAVTVALKQVSEAPTPPSAFNPAVAPDLEAVVLRALQKDPAARFASADEFIAALEAVRARLAASVSDGPVTTDFAALAAAAPVAAVADPFAPAAAAAAVQSPPQPPVPPEELPPPGPPPGRRRWPWVAAGLVLAMLGAFVLVAYLTESLVFAPDRKPVPTVVGLNLTAASTVLQQRGFEIQVLRDVNPAPRGQVFGQSPVGGVRVKEGSTVALRVSDGPGEGAVPDVAGKPRGQAAKLLAKAGFRSQVRSEPSPDVPAGRVTRTIPAAGTQIDKGTRVALYLSTGPEQVTVPDVTGQGQDQAESALAAAGLRVTVSEQESDEQEGTVLSQDPAAGTQAAEGATVTITVGTQSAKVQVPGVVGDSEAEARSALSSAGFGVAVESEPVDSRGEDGQVLDQDPGAGKHKGRGSTVTIVVGEFDPDLAPEG